MAVKLLTAELGQVIAQRSLPGLTFWNRLEGRPRADDFERALRAEVRDALFLLTRQWQLGELRGDDAGSPILAKVRVETKRVTKYQAARGDVETFDDSQPLETRVEALPVPFVHAARPQALDIRLLAGRHWLKLVRSLAPDAVPEFISQYPIAPPDPLDPLDAGTTAHVEAWSTFAAVATRRMDGVAFYDHVKSGPPRRASDGIPALTGLEAEADALAARFVAWFEKLIHQPPKATDQNQLPPGAWLPDRLEYSFACSLPEASGEKVLSAEQYFHGHLDWYNFEVDRSTPGLGEPVAPPPPEGETLTMLPTQVTFNGMPHTRWWRFEDARTNFGDIKPDTTDLGKLLLIEFGLVYANDWFTIPFTAPAGSILTVRGLAVTNVFGERTWVEAAGSGDDEDWQRWAMFLLSVKGREHVPADLGLFVPPSAPKVLEGAPREEVMFARDEAANLAWAIEKTVALPSGETKPGREAANETRAAFERRVPSPPSPPPPAEGAKVRYRLMTTVPENWIPLLSVHVDGDVRETQLQRGAMLRLIDGLAPAKVSPRTSMLRVGLDRPNPAPYFIHEEEVPRAGIRVTQSFQRTRWKDGRVWIWLGARKQTGRGEGSSGLAFDGIDEVRTPT